MYNPVPQQFDINAEKIARLARLALTPAEQKKFQSQLQGIVAFISQLKEVDVSGVEPTAQVTGLEDVLREDEVRECSKEVRDALIKAMPKRRGDLLEVPPVFE